MNNLGIGKRTEHGMSSRYNGVDIHQTRDYIKLSCGDYLRRVLQMHGWESLTANESDHHDMVPMSSDSSKQLAELSGPSKGMPERHNAG